MLRRLRTLAIPRCSSSWKTLLGGILPLVNMLLGEVIFGGLGTGLYSIILVALIGLFVGGLMVGRTPEYLGKPIGLIEWSAGLAWPFRRWQGAWHPRPAGRQGWGPCRRIRRSLRVW